MAVKILVDRETGESCFYQSTSEWAFGPVMQSDDEAVSFLDWMDSNGIRPALIKENELERAYCDFKLHSNLNTNKGVLNHGY